jgi:predicted MPP superfamily phosphohydrolase
MEICIPHHPIEKRGVKCDFWVLRNADFHYSGSAAAKTAPHFSPRVANELVHSLVVFCGLFHHSCCALVVKNDRKTPLVVKTAQNVAKEMIAMKSY